MNKDLVGKTPRDVVPGSLRKSPSWAEQLADVVYEGLIEISQTKGHPEKESAKGMKKLMEQSQRLLDKVKNPNK